MYYSFTAPSVVQQVLGYVCSLLANVNKLKLFSALLLLANSPGCLVFLSQIPFCLQLPVIVFIVVIVDIAVLWTLRSLDLWTLRSLDIVHY